MTIPNHLSRHYIYASWFYSTIYSSRYIVIEWIKPQSTMKKVDTSVDETWNSLSTCLVDATVNWIWGLVVMLTVGFKPYSTKLCNLNHLFSGYRSPNFDWKRTLYFDNKYWYSKYFIHIFLFLKKWSGCKN